ncbi:MAG: NAD(P)/FAD-dependent oxidoreductase [Actinobacteria bacterium]|nr:NAD(P)/FAD-dependent oxidoreductase [Actinomycetota bacterium]
MSYDAIVIGSGLGGCGAAAALTGAGKKVLILERLDVIGGRCSTSKSRDGFRIDIGCHHLFGCEHGAFEKAAKLVNRGGVIKFSHPTKLTLLIHDKKIIIDGDSITKTGGGADEIIINLAELIKQTNKFLPPKMRQLSYAMIGRTTPILGALLAPLTRKLDNVSIRSMLEKYMDWPMIIDFLELLQFAGWGTPSVMTPVSEGIRTMLGFSECFEYGMGVREIVGYPIGGLGTIPETICEGVREMGGEVRLGAGVKKIIVEGGAAVGVEMDDGEVIKAPIVISNAGVKETVADLVGEEHFDPAYAKKVRELIVGISCFCIRAALDTKLTDNEGLFVVPQKDTLGYYDKLWNQKITPPGMPAMMWSVPSNYDPTAAPEGKQLVYFVGPLMWGSSEPWNKPEQDAIDAMELMIPGVKDHLMWYEYLTPDTYAALGEVGSPAIGIAQCIGQVGEDRTSAISPLKGLFYVGAEVGKNMSGIGTEMSTRIGLACGNYIVKNSDLTGFGKLKSTATRYIGAAPVIKAFKTANDMP